MTTAKLKRVVNMDFDSDGSEMETRNFDETVKFYAKAQEMGFYSLNPVEKQLIDLLRFTNYHGRNVVIEVAHAMRKSHSWVRGAGGINTSTTYPDNGCYFVLSEG